MKINLNLWSYRAQFFLEREMFPTEITEETKHTFRIQKLFFEKRAVYEIT